MQGVLSCSKTNHEGSKKIGGFIKNNFFSQNHFQEITNKKGFLCIVLLYTSVFLTANFVGDRELHFFYFQCSLGTLIVQLAFAALIIFTEMKGFVPTAKIILSTCLLNLLIALSAYFYWGFIPDFWVERNIDSIETWRQIKIICLLSASFCLSALFMIRVASWVKKWLMSNWLLLRIFLATLVGVAIDLVLLIPIVLLVAPNEYLALWKMFALLSVKSILGLLTIPAVYLLILLLKSAPQLRN